MMNFNLLYDQVKNVPNEYEIILCGDRNARAGVMPDFDVNFTGSNEDQLLPGGQVNSSHMTEKNGVFECTSPIFTG